MISILRCDPPQSSDVRESVEAARALSCTTLAFVPLGEEVPGSTLTPLACHVLCLLSLMDLAPALVLGGMGVYPRVPLPTPDTIGKPTVATIGQMASGGAVTHLFLGRGVGEWLVQEAPPGTADAWRSALPGLVGCILGGGDAALVGTVSALLGCPPTPLLATLGASKGFSLAVGSGGSYHYPHLSQQQQQQQPRAAIDDTLIPPSALSFLTRQRLLGRGCSRDGSDAPSIPWWRAYGIPDAWHKPVSTLLPSMAPTLMTLPPAPTLEPSPPIALAPTSVFSTPSSSPPSSPPPSLPWRVAILGGSFNPPTLAHTLLASQVLSTGSADEVWVVPCGPRADKGSVATSSLQRVILTALAVEGGGSSSSGGVKILPLELYEEGALATVDLLARLEALVEREGGRGKEGGEEEVVVEWGGGGRSARRRGEVQFSLVIGTDALPSLPSWRHPHRLMVNARFIVCPRPGYKGGEVVVEKEGEKEKEGGEVKWPRLAVWINGVGEGGRGATPGSSTFIPPYAALHLSSSEVRLRAREAGGGGEGGGGGGALAVCAALNALLCNHAAVYVGAMGLFSR